MNQQTEPTKAAVTPEQVRQARIEADRLWGIVWALKNTQEIKDAEATWLTAQDEADRLNEELINQFRQ